MIAASVLFVLQIFQNSKSLKIVGCLSDGSRSIMLARYVIRIALLYFGVLGRSPVRSAGVFEAGS